MKKSQYVLFFVCMMLALQMNAQSIQFTSGSWTDIQAKAQKESKLIFIDIYAVWCGPCKLMEKTVFPKPAVIDQFNTKFINYKIDAEKGEGIKLAEKYAVSSFPTYLFVDSKGVLVHKIEGAVTAEKFVAESIIAINKNAKK